MIIEVPVILVDLTLTLTLTQRLSCKNLIPVSKRETPDPDVPKFSDDLRPDGFAELPIGIQNAAVV